MMNFEWLMEIEKIICDYIQEVEENLDKDEE